jgi:hypothetical protein
MLDPQGLLRALHEKTEEFHDYQYSTKADRAAYHEQLQALSDASLASILTRLSAHDWPGALPSPEWSRKQQVALPFQERFLNHQQARQWASTVLSGKTTIAVDGSQLMPSKEHSVPVALVQVGWYINPHDPQQAFEKQTQTTVLGPQELLASGSEEKLFHDQYISLTRYQQETTHIQRLIETRGNPHTLALFDGSLLISFAEVLIEQHRSAYLNATLSMLESSREQSVPLVGYIDTSMARDLVKMLSMYFFSNPPSQQDGILDADLVSPLLPNWGDRTIAFALKRKGILKQYDNAGGGLGFCYLRTAMDRPPARLEFPWWIVESGQLDAVCDSIRAECIIGNGYPYAIETADQVAWFSPRDRALFHTMLQRYLTEQQLDFSLASKRRSKQRRR